MDAFWPGPLTLVFPASPNLPGHLLGSTSTIALRMSDAPVAGSLLQHAGGPLTSTSANRSGRPPRPKRPGSPRRPWQRRRSGPGRRHVARFASLHPRRRHTRHPRNPPAGPRPGNRNPSSSGGKGGADIPVCPRRCSYRRDVDREKAWVASKEPILAVERTASDRILREYRSSLLRTFPLAKWPIRGIFKLNKMSILPWNQRLAVADSQFRCGFRITHDPRIHSARPSRYGRTGDPSRVGSNWLWLILLCARTILTTLRWNDSFGPYPNNLTVYCGWPLTPAPFHGEW